MICSVDDCERPVKGKREWCAMHVERWRRWGDPTETRPRIRAACIVEGCDRLNEAQGWCQLHYRRYREHGDPLHRPHSTRTRAGTQVENMADRREHGAGYARGNDAPRAVQLTDELVQAIRATYRPYTKGRGQHAIAQQFGLSRTTVQRIVTESERWAESA